MKIQKFNKNKASFKLGDLIEIQEKREIIYKIKEELKTSEKNIESLLYKYLYINQEKIVNDYDISDFYITENSEDSMCWVIDFKFDISKKKFIIVVWDDEQDERSDIDLTPEYFKDLMTFLENPDVYEDSKKYNL